MDEKDFTITDFDNEHEMIELLNTQRMVITDLEEQLNEQNKKIKDVENELFLEQLRHLEDIEWEYSIDIDKACLKLWGISYAEAKEKRNQLYPEEPSYIETKDHVEQVHARSNMFPENEITCCSCDSDFDSLTEIPKNRKFILINKETGERKELK